MRFIFLLLSLTLILPAISLPSVEEVPVTSSGQDVQTRIGSLLDSKYEYDLGFLWLDQVAVATFKLQKSTKPGLYIASLSAKTVGIAAKLTGNRKQQYVSMMKMMPDGSFRSVRHTSQKEKGGVNRTKVYVYDYDKREVLQQYFKKNKLVSEKILKIEGESFPSDILTTYFNLAAGVYGPMEVGAHYEVPTFSKKGVGNIYIDFISSSERPKKSFFADDLLICQVQVDQDVFDTKNGIIYIGYDAKMNPARGIVTNIIGMGDVRGVMKN